MFVTLSCILIFRIDLRLCMWKHSSSFRCFPVKFTGLISIHEANEDNGLVHIELG